MNDAFDEWNTYALKKELKERDINFNNLISNSKLKIIAITGVRRCGKTSILILLQHMLNKKYKVCYVNLEDNRIKNSVEPLNSLLKWFGDKGYLLLDEITNVKDWENWLSRNHEMLKGKLYLILSSSRGSLILPSKPLRGRILPYEIYPLSFSEFLKFKGVSIEKTTFGRGKLEKALEEYLIYGGFPEVVLLKGNIEKINLLNSYFKDIIGLDVAEISKEDISTVELFGKYVINGLYFSASKCLNFFKSLGYKISKQSLLYLEKYSQESYLFFFVQIFSKTIKDRLQYPRKSYIGDTGLIYSINGKIEYGKLFENVVFLELKRRLPRNCEINYWKSKAGFETDFVIREGIKVKKILQVVYEIDNKKVKDREINGIVGCAKEFSLKEGIIITKDYKNKEVVDNVRLHFIPLEEWLLNRNL